MFLGLEQRQNGRGAIERLGPTLAGAETTTSVVKDGYREYISAAVSKDDF